jgi:hypothetical protein
VFEAQVSQALLKHTTPELMLLLIYIKCRALMCRHQNAHQLSKTHLIQGSGRLVRTPPPCTAGQLMHSSCTTCCCVEGAGHGEGPHTAPAGYSSSACTHTVSQETMNCSEQPLLNSLKTRNRHVDRSGAAAHTCTTSKQAAQSMQPLTCILLVCPLQSGR